MAKKPIFTLVLWILMQWIGFIQNKKKYFLIKKFKLKNVEQIEKVLILKIKKKTIIDFKRILPNNVFLVDLLEHNFVINVWLLFKFL